MPTFKPDSKRRNWYRWVFDHFDVPEGARVLELGSGPAKLWQENLERVPDSWDVTLSDASLGMLSEARAQLQTTRPFTFEQVDVQEIPYADASFDVVIAVHMLYHVPNQTRALAEIRRVLKPGGSFYASTNGRTHMQEIGDLAAHIATGEMLEQIRAAHTRHSFRLEDGVEMLSAYFGEVNLYSQANPLEVTEAEPLLAYMLSATAAAELRERPSAEQVKKLQDFRTYLEKRIAAEGSIRITRATGLFVAGP